MRTRLLLAALAAIGVMSWYGWREVSAADGPNFTTWEGYSGGADSSQYSSLKQINKNNVKQLQQVWTYPAPNGGNFTPTVVDGTMYLLKTGNAIAALDATTGVEKWAHPAQGISARGINYWEGKDRKDRRLIYAAGGYVYAINALTGEPVLAFGDNGRADMRVGTDRDPLTLRTVSSGNPGHIAGDLIILSMGVSAGGDTFSGSPGDIQAWNVVTGKLAWVFHSIPRPGEFGYDTWPADAYKWAGGVHNWNEMTVDEKRGIVYIPFGTARYDFVGANRKGNNLFGNSLVALELKTGKRIWHQQLVHHDLWDYDLPQAPKLLTVKHDGKSVDVVAQATKHGFLFVFERETGKPLWPIEERPVPQTDVPGEWTSPTQPFPTAPPPFARQSFTEKDINPYIPESDQEKLQALMKASRNEGLFTPPSVQGTIELPGHNGGANWGSSAVNPTGGTMFIVSKELPTYIKLIPPGEGRGGAGAAKGGGAGKGKGKAGDGPPEPLAAGKGKAPAAPVGPPPPGSPGDFVRYNAPYDFLTQSNGLSAISPPWSQLTAYDLNTGKIKWQVPDGTVPELADKAQGITGVQFARGGPIATASGLLIVPTGTDRMVRFYDQDNGKILHEMKLPAAAEGVGAVYEVDGREYIALIVAAGNGMQGPRLGADGKASPSGPPSYIVFALPKK